MKLARRPSARTRRLHRRAQRLIPGGAHTYSKGDDQFPSNAPALVDRARGCWCWDTDGRKWLDFGMGLRSVILGHAFPAVSDAARRELARGCNFTRPTPLEGELAERLKEVIPCAEMVKFAKNGSDVTTAATRLARAYTGRALIAACRTNPFYSFDDWWIGKTVMDAGIPASISRMTLLWDYNDLASLRKLFDRHPGRIACVILEPVAAEPPRAGFLQGVLRLARANGALVIFDEMISGFRYHRGGAQRRYGVVPDLATFGKALANGFSVSALCGRAEVMSLGGSRKDRERVFLLSCTHGAETHGLAAAIACQAVLSERDVAGHVARLGRRLQAGLNGAARAAGIAELFECGGHPASPVLICRGPDGKPSPALRTLFLQEMCRHGILMPWVAISLSHSVREIDRTVAAARGAFEVYARAAEEGAERYLEGPAVRPVFRRFNDS